MGGVVVRTREVATVLVVDDFEPQLNTWQRDFTRAGKRVVRATSAEVAIREARAHSPQLAIVDLFLGAEQGTEVVRQLKAGNAHTFVVVATAMPSGSYAMAAVRAGADDFVSKPICATQILQRVESGVIVDPDWNRVPTLEEIEWEHISRVFLASNNNVTRASERLGVSRQTLQSRFRKLRRTRPRG